MTKNERTFSDHLSLWQTALGEVPSRTIIALAAETRPQVLLLADPRLTPAWLIDLLARLRSPQPEQIILYGRLLENFHADLAAVEELFTELGYQPGLGFDPNIARGFVLAQARLPRKD